MKEQITKTKQTDEIVGPPIYKLPLLGERVPPFRTETTKGPINFPFDYAGKWVVFFSHPGDFTPVCTTEFMILQSMQEEFREMNTELLALSVESVDSHLAWIRSIEQIKWNGLENIVINFPMIGDPTMEIAKKYGMVHRGATESETIRALFVIDPESIVRNIIYYSNITGRNINEVKRVVQALQISYKDSVSTPANWEPGEDVILPSPKTTAEVAEREKQAEENPDIYCVAPYLCFKPPSVDQSVEDITPQALQLKRYDIPSPKRINSLKPNRPRLK